MSVMSRAVDTIYGSRIITTRILAGIVFFLLIFSDHYWTDEGFADTAFEAIGLFLVVVSAFGRLWASMYIAGYKQGRLITDGPYSIVRNPLYVFSFIGAVGIGFSSERFVVLAILVLAFLLYYPRVVRGEEDYLLGKHGQDFARYEEQTPRFIPRLALFHEPDTYVVNARAFRKSFVDTAFIILVFALLEVIERLHDAGILPVLFKTP
ncbi:MAG: isoprenylcysteine carboxylmethyltransferase family protein [Syntrophobacteraceae bacterium]|nr:isoprenylcysteine carboxylmethyltransferase family protein [Desulfobacteraceae bacterium]